MNKKEIKEIAINFTEWLAEKQYQPFNKFQFWGTENGVKTTSQLFDEYIDKKNIFTDIKGLPNDDVKVDIIHGSPHPLTVISDKYGIKGMQG